MDQQPVALLVGTGLLLTQRSGPVDFLEAPQRLERLKLIVQNRRFLMLTGRQSPIWPPRRWALKVVLSSNGKSASISNTPGGELHRSGGLRGAICYKAKATGSGWHERGATAGTEPIFTSPMNGQKIMAASAPARCPPTAVRAVELRRRNAGPGCARAFWHTAARAPNNWTRCWTSSAGRPTRVMTTRAIASARCSRSLRWRSWPGGGRSPRSRALPPP